MNSSRSKWGINLKKVFCPKCKTEQPRLRKPKGLYEVLWGGNTCENCGCKMDKYGNERTKK
jgi:hypothetical protein